MNGKMQASGFEKLLARIFPRMALERLAYRSAFEMASASRAYDAAKMGRRTDGWLSPKTSANAEINAALPLIRARARELARNNSFASTVVRKMAAKTVGTGIIPRLKVEEIGDPRRKQSRAIWDAFVDNCDPERRHDFHGLMRIMARATFESGESLIRKIPRPSSWKMTIPLQIEVLEGDYIDSFRNFSLPDGGMVIQGVQYDGFGRRTGYWMFDHHPGDTFAFTRQNLQSKLVPADEICHVFDALRPGQARGVSIFAPVALKMKDVEDYDEAELMRQKIASCFAAFVKKQGGPAASPLASNTTTDGKTNARVERLSPGTIQYLGLDEDVTFGTPPTSNAYAGYMSQQLHTIAAGCGVTYEMMTGDLQGTNFSSMRGGMLDFYDLVDDWRWLTFIPQAHNPIWEAVGQLAAARGLRNATDPWTATWTPPARRMINPKEDIDAARESVRSGVRPLFDVIAEQGMDPEEALEEMAESNKLLDKLGLILDSDPRRVGRVSAGGAPTPGQNPEAPSPTDPVLAQK